MKETFYVGLLKLDGLKLLNLILNVIILFLGPLLLYAVIWYERFSADLNYRTLINQLLSHLCWIEIFSCIFSRLGYFVIYFLSPLPAAICDLAIFLGRYTFLITTAEIALRQMIKYFYIFNWKNLVGLDDDFAALFITLLNLLLSFVFIFVTYFLGFHNEELDFHICTGRKPLDNVAIMMKKIGFADQMSKNSSEWLKDVYGTDPMENYAVYVCLILIIFIAQIILYSDTSHFKKCMKSMKNITTKHFKTAIETNTNIQNEKFLETKSNMLGTIQTFSMIILSILSLIPIVVGKSLAKKNIELINSGYLRTMVYVGKISLPVFLFLIFPLLIVAFNPKVRNSLIRELKVSHTSRWIMTFIHSNMK
jgi:hypothetical protein